MIKFLTLKIFTLCILGISSLQGEENYLNIDAKHYDADQNNNIMNFRGDVKMTKNKDILLCQKLVVHLKVSPEDKTKKIPKEYIATGNVSFVLYTNNNLKGKGDVVYYYPKEKKYIIMGNGYLENIKEGKIVYAEKIYIDELTGQTKLDGGKDKPIKFRLRLQDNKDTKTSKGK